MYQINQKIKGKEIEKVKCWEFFKCDKKECPAYKSRNLRCWLFSGTHCRDEIQGKFIDKIEMCLDCKVFKTNMDIPSMKKSCEIINKQIKEYTQMLQERDRKLESMSMELALGLSEAFEALKKISTGDPTVRIPETSEVELIRKLKNIINMTAENIGEIVEQSHEFAMGLAEHFDILHKVSQGDLSARVSGESKVELLEALKNVTNEMIQSIDREITKRKLAEKELNKSNEFRKRVMESATNAIYVIDLEGKFTLVNQRTSEITGYEIAELIGSPFSILFTPQVLAAFNKQFIKVITKGISVSQYEAEPIRKDGTKIIITFSIAPLLQEGKITGVVGTAEDITERKRMEEALRESEKKYIDLYQNAPDGYHSLGSDSTIIEVNNTWLRMLGYKRDEIVGKMKLTDMLTEDGVKFFQKTFPKLKQKGSIENIDYSFKRKDGSLLPVLVNATAVYDEKGEFVCSRAILRDNTEKKAYEKKLERAAREWRATFDSMPYGVMLLDSEVNIIRANHYIAELYTIPIQNMSGENCCALNFGSNLPIEFCTMLKSKTAYTTETLEYLDTNLNKNFMMHGTPILGEEGFIKGYVLSVIDISDMKEKEKRLIESKDAFLNMLKELDISYKELKGLYESLIHSFVNAIDAKSPWTKGHSERVTHYAVSIAKELEFKEGEIETLRTASLLHDIGKIGTYDVILEKPGKLTDEEFALIRMHPVRGEEILKPLKQFTDLLPIVRHHHERLDGRGYPDGLSNGQIPFLSKIITIADSFDSMTSDRPYRPAPPREYAISELKRCSGTQFEPQAVDAFLRFLEKSEQ